MPDTPTTRYDVYVGFFFLGSILGFISLFAGWLETLYAVCFFLAGVNMIFTNQKPQPDPTHSTTTHFEIYSRDNVVNYILAAVLILEALIYFLLPISKPIVIFALWLFNVVYYPRFMNYFANRLGKQLVSSYLREQLPELSAQQVQAAVTTLNTAPQTTATELATSTQIAPDAAAKLVVMYNKYVDNNLS